MSRYIHDKVNHELIPVSGYGSRLATTISGKKLIVHGSLLNIDNYNYGQGDIATAIDMVANIEAGMAATKNYEAGECFVYNAILYVVTEDVDNGDDFVIGENCELAPNLSDQILAVNAKTEAAADQLTVNNTNFYFDSHDGQYGYNTSAARGADTFVPFKSGLELPSTLTITNYGGNNNSGRTITGLDDDAYYLVCGYSLTLTKGDIVCTIPDYSSYIYGSTNFSHRAPSYIVKPVNGEIAGKTTDGAGQFICSKLAAD